MAATWYSGFLLFTVLITLDIVIGKKVLIMTMQMGGHVSEFGTIARELLLKGNYEVHIVLDENLKVPPQLQVKGLKVLRYKSPDPSKVDPKIFDREVSRLAFQSPDPAVAIEFTKPRLNLDCRLLLQDVELYKMLEAEKYDIALVDGMIYCYHLIPYRLHIPMISVSAYRWPIMTRLFPLTTALCTDIPPNIFERVLAMYEAYLVDQVPATEIDESEFLDYIPTKPLKSLGEIAQTSLLWILAQGNVFDCPKPTMPNLIHVGGLNTKPSKPLQGEMLKYVNAAKDGVIVVSFGSMLSNQPKHFLQKMAKAFKDVPQNVIWRVSKDALAGVDVSGNVKVVDWLPQNDLLGHNNTRLFITHCGNNGQWEGFYHGVPMLGMPVWGDQFPNADRLLHHEIGLRLDVWSFTSDELLSAMKELTGNEKYHKNIKRLMKIFSDLPEHPSKTAAYWVDHVIKHGADHLRTTASKMSPSQFYMLDIYASATFVLLVSLIVLKYLVIFLIRFCTRDQRKSKSE